MLPFTVKPQEFDLSGNNNGLFTPVFDNQPEYPTIDPDKYNPCDGKTNKGVLLTECGPNDELFYSYSLQEHARTFDGKYGDPDKFDEAIRGYALESFEIGTTIVVIVTIYYFRQRIFCIDFVSPLFRTWIPRVLWRRFV